MTAKKPLVVSSIGDVQQIQTGDFVDVPAGGTGATTAAGARSSLGLVIGTNVQAHGASLDAIQALGTVGTLFRTGADTYATRVIVAPAAGITLSNADGVAGAPTIALANDLSALEALGGTGFAVRTAADTWAQRSITVQPRLTVTNPTGAAGDVVLDLAAVTDVGGGSFKKFIQDAYGRVSGTSAVTAVDLTALLNSIYLGLAGGTMTGPLLLSQDAVAPMEAVTKRQFDAQGEGRVDKVAVQLYSNVNINVSNPGTSTFDSTVASNGDRIFLNAQTAGAENGPWVFNGSGVAMTRPTDWSHDADMVSGATFYVINGSTAAGGFKNTVWTMNTAGPYTLGTTAVTFVQTNGTGDINVGNGLNKNGNTLSAVISGRLQFTTGQIDLGLSGVTGGTYTKLDVDVYGRVTGGHTATPADIGAQAASIELDGVSSLAATGIVARTAAGTYAPRTLTAPAAGITITNPGGVAGNPTLVLANDLAGLEGLTTIGFATRTAADTWVTRIITVAARLSISNGAGTAGDVSLDLAASGITPGTYNAGVTFDTYGRATNGTSIANFNTPGSTLTNDEATTAVICTAVYLDAASGFKRAVANSSPTADVYGLCFADINSAAQGIVATSGPMSATTAQWDAVSGQTGGLTVGATYFLDNTTAGHITTTAPTSGYIQAVGKAESTTKLTVRIGQRIQL